MSNKYIITSNGRFASEDELYHHGVKGQKWGVRRYQNEDGTLTNAGKKKKKLTYREKVEQSMREYDESHPGRSKKDNYTIAIRNEARRQSEKYLKRQYASMALMPLFGIGIIPAVANQYVAQKRNNTLSEIMDEYNIENAKRVVNM